MRSLRLAVAGRLLQNPRESGASRVLDHLLLALNLSSLALVLMYTSSSLCWTQTRVLCPGPRQVAGVRRPPHTLLMRARDCVVTVRRTRD
jgi:hypothetical protein